MPNSFNSSEQDIQQFSSELNTAVETFIRLTAPYRELIPQVIEELQEEKKEEKILPEIVIELASPLEPISPLTEEKSQEEERQAKKIAQEADKRAEKQLEQIFEILTAEEKIARDQRLEQENVKFAKEAEDYQQFISKIRALSLMICKAYEQARKDNNKLQVAYLDKIKNSLQTTVEVMSQPALPFEQKKKALEGFLRAAIPSQTILEAAEPVISLGLALAGGVVGIFAGILIGIPLGALFGLAILFGVLNATPSDPHVLLFLFAAFGGSGALYGAAYGAYMGATQVSKYLYNLSHSTFFKPAEIRDETQALIGYPLRHAKLTDGNQQIKNKLLEATPLCAANVDVVTSYLSADDKLEIARLSR